MYERDRDVHAANNMIIMIKMIDVKKVSPVPVGHREFKPVEIVNSSNIKELTTAEAGKSHPKGCD